MVFTHFYSIFIHLFKKIKIYELNAKYDLKKRKKYDIIK